MTVQDAMADTSLILLVGGLSMLGLIMVLVGLQSLFPERARASGPEPERHRARQLRPLRETSPLFAERKRAARPGPFRKEEHHLPLDLALGDVVERQLGEPRILHTSQGAGRIRLYRCRSCEPNEGEGGGCVFERASMEESLRIHWSPKATVHEVACRTAGAEQCEFEVTA